MKRFLPEILVLCATLLAVTYGFAQTWIHTSASTFAPFSTAMSADGRKILVVGSGIIHSVNSGQDWTTTSAANYGSVAGVSADGSKMVMNEFTNSGHNIFISSDSGNSWIPTTLPSTNWQACASSADGSKLAVAAGGLNRPGQIYTSTNAGVTWVTNNILAKYWEGIASSANGSRLAAVANNDFIYLSTNSGSTWNPAAGTTSAWTAICSSADGRHLVATGDRTGISGDGGTTWTYTNLVGSGVACSADGSSLAVCNRNGAIYTSTNYGLNWATTNVPGRSWFSIASSADGGELVAGESAGMWIRQAAQPPKLIASSSNNNLKISWLIPSTNFVLQSNTDMLNPNWVAVANNPSLNVSNLQNEVVIPTTNISSFYRLATP